MSNNSATGVTNALRELERDAIAGSSVSTQIAHLIPYLQYRKEAARKLDGAGMGKTRDELHQLIANCNSHIKEVLGLD